MTSLELLAALAKRYDITNPNLENLPDSILLAIQHEEHNTLSYKQAVASLAHQAQIILEPLDTFAARAHDAIRAKAAPGEGMIHGIAREQAETLAERERQLMALMRDVHALIDAHYQASPPSSPDDAPRLLDTLKIYILDLLHCEVEAQREFLDAANAERNTIAGILAFVFGFLRDFGQGAVICGPQLLPPLKALCARYSLPVAPLDTLAERLLSHFAQMERDAAEAHSAAKALGVEVKDLADRAKQMTQSSTDLEQRQRLIHVLAEQMANVRRRLAVPVNESVMIHLDDLLSQRDLFRANAVDALDRLAKVEAKLQAINEALPADLRHGDDLAAAVRTLVLTAETRYGQWSELARDTTPAVQTVAALRYALESRDLRLALARELYDADDNLLELLETADAHQMTETLLATLATNRAAPEYPPLPKPSALARTLEGPACVAYYGHLTRPGRIEAIGDDLLRFHPVEGDAVTLNATRRDLEVYALTEDELAAELAKVEARKTRSTNTPPAARPPDVADDDLPF